MVALGTGRWALVAGHWSLGTGRWALVAGHWGTWTLRLAGRGLEGVDTVEVGLS